MSDDFGSQLATLCAGFNVPCTPERQDAYTKAFGKLNPVAWARLVEYCLGEHGPDRMPTVRQLWGVRSEMRAHARPLAAEPAEPAWPGDAWDIAANHHLLTHIREAIAQSPRRYGDPGLTNVGPRGYPPSQTFVANVAKLVAAKNAWAADMRDLAASNNGEVDPQLQRSIWADLIGRAESATTQKAAA